MRRILSSDGSRRVVVLHGLGGIGKTQLAVAYAKRYRDEYSGVFWVNTKDEASIRQSIANVARQILQQHPDATHNLQQNHEGVVEAVKTWLSLPGNTRWLIVYDNYDNPKLRGRTNDTGTDINYLFPTAYQGSIVITTRVSQTDVGHEIRVKKLESTDSCLEILSRTSGRDDLRNGKTLEDMYRSPLTIYTDADAMSLVSKLDGLPLALATAGAYLKRTSVSLSDYCRLYETSWERLHANAPALGSYQDRTLCSTWQLSYDQVQMQSPLAAHLLQWWAYFDNEDIWYELLQGRRRRRHEDDPSWMGDLSNELDFNSAMGTLSDYGLVETFAGALDSTRSRGYSIHSCLHSWIIHVLNKEKNDYLAKTALEFVASCVPSNEDDQFWLFQRRLLSHAIKACATIPDHHDLLWVFHDLGILYQGQWKLAEAEDMYKRALRGYEKACGPEHLLTFNIFNNLGILYVDQCKYAEAKEVYIRALRGKENALGPDDPSTVSTLHNLAVLYAEEGSYTEAKEIFFNVLEKREKMLGPDHPSTLMPVCQLGFLYKCHGNYIEAEKMYARALHGCEKALGPDHPFTLNIVRCQGVLYVFQRKVDEAEKMLARALRGYEKAWGSESPHTLDTVCQLGRIYVLQEKYSEAEKMYTTALRGYERALGPEHPATLNAVNSMALVYIGQGKHTEAEEMLQQALQGHERVLGSQNIGTKEPAIITVWTMGFLADTRGQLLEARTYYQRAYHDLRNLFGPSHRDVVWMKNVLLDLETRIAGQFLGAADVAVPTPVEARKGKRRNALRRLLGLCS